MKISKKHQTFEAIQ